MLELITFLKFNSCLLLTGYKNLLFWASLNLHSTSSHNHSPKGLCPISYPKFPLNQISSPKWPFATGNLHNSLHATQGWIKIPRGCLTFTRRNVRGGIVYPLTWLRVQLTTSGKEWQTWASGESSSSSYSGKAYSFHVILRRIWYVSKYNFRRGLSILADL